MNDSTPPLQLAIGDEPALLNRCVLLVDDHPPTQFAVASVLTDAGADVRFAGDTHEAVFRCVSRLEAARPFDLVIVSMHPLLGVETCRLLREMGYRGPMIALGQADDADAVTDAGADALLPGATDGDALYATAAELVSRAAVRDVQTASPQEPPVLSDLAAFPQMHVMLERFLDQLPQRISAMADAAASDDIDELQSLVAELKRSAGSHGFIDISREAAETERHLRATDHLTDALTQLAELCRRASVQDDRDPSLPPSA